MVKRAFKLTIDGKTYQVSVLHPGAISIDGNVFTVEMEKKGVRINGEPLTASLSEGFAIVGGKLYETEWEVE
jgi:hypothetical protein